MSTPSQLRYLLLQIRDDDDPMRRQEVQVFAQALGCEVERIGTHNLLTGGPKRDTLDRCDMTLLGGSGDYSAAAAMDDGQNAWLARVFDSLRELHALAKPTFASCWGFQAMARALGGDCVHDPQHAELGTTPLRLLEAGQGDPVFSSLPVEFTAHSGHEDRVTKLPSDAVLLASSEFVAEQAMTFAGKPIYATQFHPELTLKTFLQRVEAYPKYVQEISGLPYEEFAKTCRETPEANGLLRRMVEVVFG